MSWCHERKAEEDASAVQSLLKELEKQIQSMMYWCGQQKSDNMCILSYKYQGNYNIQKPLSKTSSENNISTLKKWLYEVRKWPTEHYFTKSECESLVL